MSYLPYGSNLRCSRFYPLLLGGYELLTRPGPLSDQLLKKKKKQRPSIVNTTKRCLSSVHDYSAD